jgi:threonine/homoserine/homoserine lactone efflux protein
MRTHKVFPLASVFINGLSTGLMLQLAIGPVFFFIANLSIQKTVADGLAAVLAVTIVDYLYITLAVLGLGVFLKKPEVKQFVSVIGPLVLSIYGGLMIKNSLTLLNSSTIPVLTSSPLQSFAATFLLTISSPMGIIFWTSLFASKVSELKYTNRELVLFGFSTGLATVLFMGTAAIIFSNLKHSIPSGIVQILNGTVGLVLIYYGLTRLFSALKQNKYV